MIKITKAGWIYIGITIFLGIAGVNTGNNLIYLIDAALLSFMGISGFFGKKNLSRIDLSVEFSDVIYARTPFTVKIKLKNNKKYFPSFLLKARIKDQTVIIPFVEPLKVYENHVLLTAEERGFFSLDEVSLCSPFPFNFFIRCIKIPIDTKVIVYPKPEKCHLKLYSKEGKIKEKEEGSYISQSGEIHAVKDYSPGVPIKYIHWKASAKTGDLKIKEFSKSYFKSRIIDFDEIDIPDIEKKISCLTYVVLLFYKKRISFKFKFKGKVFDGITEKEKILKTLALYGKKDES
jgi:uncharacterized protein (DUF58 family)